MNLYRFKTFRTSYYFPDITKGGEFLYCLYTPFGSKLAKMYWWAFRHLRIVRLLNKVDLKKLDFPYERILGLCPQGSLVSFNMGTPGIEQKISMLGLEPSGKRFFAKYSDKIIAKELSRNEITILKSLAELNIAPELLSSVDTDEFVFFSTSCVDGTNPNDIQLNEKIVDLAIKINQIGHKADAIQTSLSHGDFTPWNVMIDKYGEYHIIDWEMAKNRVLGYDIFTYLTHVAALLTPNEPLDKVIEEKKQIIDRYFKSFKIDDWFEYLMLYARERAGYECSKGHNEYALKLESLKK